jgi:hypothetical protein
MTAKRAVPLGFSSPRSLAKAVKGGAVSDVKPSLGECGHLLGVHNPGKKLPRLVNSMLPPNAQNSGLVRKSSLWLNLALMMVGLNLPLLRWVEAD